MNKYQKTITRKEYIISLSNKRIKNKQICGFLLEQKYFSGIGNFLRSEIVYTAKIRPDKILSNLSDFEKGELYDVSLKVILEAYLTQGISGGYFPKGTFKLKCYNRNFDPYGNIVVKEYFKDKRSMYWVPEIQN